MHALPLGLGTRHNQPMPASTLDPVKQDGCVTLILGCMFSGKTTELISRIRKFPPEEVLAVKHSVDTRFGGAAIISHSGLSVPAVTVSSADQIVGHTNQQHRLVAVDEGHFFDSGLVLVARRLAEAGCGMIIASLEPDSWGCRFAINTQLRRISSECLLKSAACARCGASADRTQRLTPVVGGNMVVSPAQYEPRCRACWRPPEVAGG